MPTKSEFVHLHLHTHYSLLDGANQLTPLLNQVRDFGQEAVAMTDHGNLFGAIDFYQKAKAKGIKPIVGCEAYLAPGNRRQREGLLAHNDYYHLILLATNLKGYHNLIKLSSKAYLEGFYYKPRMDKELLQKHHEGIIALSGCLSGEVPQLIGQQDIEKATQTAGEYQVIFGKDCYYLEIQANGLEQQLIANRGLIEIHKKLGIPMAGTNDCHYLKKEDARPHEIMLCLQTGKTLKDANRMKFDTDQLYVKSTEEMVEEFSEIPEAVLNTSRIAEICNLDLSFGTPFLPHYHPPEGMTREQWAIKCAERLEKKIYYEGSNSVAAYIATPHGCGSDWGSVAPKEYWQEVRRICDHYDVLLIADEVVTGFGRTGPTAWNSSVGLEVLTGRWHPPRTGTGLHRCLPHVWRIPLQWPHRRQI